MHLQREHNNLCLVLRPVLFWSSNLSLLVCPSESSKCDESNVPCCCSFRTDGIHVAETKRTARGRVQMTFRFSSPPGITPLRMREKMLITKPFRLTRKTKWMAITLVLCPFESWYSLANEGRIMKSGKESKHHVASIFGRTSNRNNVTPKASHRDDTRV